MSIPAKFYAIKNPFDILKRVNSYMILQNIITTSLERGKNDDDDVIDLKT
ncbi:hypothetical protein [Flavobacterium amnicola]|nr:hypothetical protein [Flavobacterium amnicola]